MNFKMSDFIDQIIDWGAFDASTNISKRTGGVTKESIEFEVSLWEKQLKLLTPLNFDKIKKEINDWKIEVPSYDALTYENIAITYARLVSYKLRAATLLAEARSWRETCETASKFIEELSQGAYTGTAVEKKANAMHIIQPFVHLKVQTARLENYLDKIHGSVIFCATQLDLLIKERQSRAKFNHKLGHDGEELLASSDNAPEVIEENGEIWTPIKKHK